MYNGFDLAILPSLGKSPAKMEVLHISAIAFARIFAPSFKELPEILSIPIPQLRLFEQLEILWIN